MLVVGVEHVVGADVEDALVAAGFTMHDCGYGCSDWSWIEEDEYSMPRRPCACGAPYEVIHTENRDHDVRSCLKCYRERK